MHWFKMRKASYVFRLALCVLVFGCDSDDKAKEWAETYTASSGLTKGTQLKVAKGSYSGDKPITMEEADSVFDEIIAEETASEYVAQLGPAIDFQPDGAVFDPPAKLYLPFSSKAFDKAREEIPFTHLVVVAKRDGYVGMDVGPVGIIGMDVGPVGKTLTSSQLIGKAFGTIGVIANEGNAENDLLAVINVSHFTTFQVLLMNIESNKCVPDCKDKSCGADGCGGDCGQCTEDTLCEDGICESGLTCKEVFDCIWNCPGGSVEQCIEPCLSKATPKSAVAGSALSECVTKLCAPKVGSELRDCALASFYNECSELFTGCVKCSPVCDPGGCDLNNCGIPCINCDPAEKCSGTKCVPGDNCATVLQCFEFCQDDEACKQECMKGASEGAKVALYHLGQCMAEACPDGSEAGCNEEASKNACSKEYNQCQSGCVPFCGDAKCGDNGCGGSCGSCDAGSVCSNGSCQSSLTCKEIYNCMMKPDCDLNCQAACQAQGTSDVQTDIAALTDCVKGECGSGAKPDCSKPAIEGKCSAAFGICMKCSPSCTNQDCGTNDCGLSCGDDCASGLACDNSTNKCVTGGACVQLIACKGDCWFNNPDSEQKKDACVELCDAQASEDAKSTLAAYVKCMSAACLEKGTDDCSSDDEEIKKICADEKALCYTVCTPECTGKNCGDDGCGSTCGECSGGKVCDTVTSQCVEAFSCAELMNCCTGIDPVTQSEQYKSCMDLCSSKGTSAAKAQVMALNACVEKECTDDNTPDCQQSAYQNVCNPQYAVCIDCTPVVCSAGECGGNGCNGSCPCNAGKICNEESKMCVTQYIDNDDGTASAPLHNLTWMTCTMPQSSSETPAWKKQWKLLLDASGKKDPSLCPDGGIYQYCFKGKNNCNGAQAIPPVDDGTGELVYGEYPGDAYVACQEVNAESFGGHTDWRVPTLDELKTMAPLDSVFDEQVVWETGLGQGNDAPSNPVYWSANSESTDKAYAVNVYDGSVSIPPKQDHYRLVRCVRDTVCVPNCAPGQKCGDDGCGGSCGGGCAANETCVNGVCKGSGSTGDSCGSILATCVYPKCWNNLTFAGDVGECLTTCMKDKPVGEQSKLNDLHFCMTDKACYGFVNTGGFSACWPQLKNDQCSNEYDKCVDGCDCAGKKCGADGCGGSCGTCAGQLSCEAGICMGSCMDGYDCGWNCPAGDEACLQNCIGSVHSEDQGLLSTLHTCIKTHCETAPNFAECAKSVELNDCKTEYYACSKCTPNCTGKACGADGCGGQCDPGCPQGDFCSEGQCQAPTGCQLALECVLDCGGNPDNPNCGDDCKPNVSNAEWIKQQDLMNCVITESGGPEFTKDQFLNMIYNPSNCGDLYDDCLGCNVSAVCDSSNCGDNNCGGLCQCGGGLVCQNDTEICQPCLIDAQCEAPTNECFISKCIIGSEVGTVATCKDQKAAEGMPCSNGSGQCVGGQCVASGGGAGNCDPNGVYVTCLSNLPLIEVPLYQEDGKTKMALGIDPQFGGNGSITIKFKMPDLVSMDGATVLVTEIESNQLCGNPVSSSEFVDDLNNPLEFEVSFDFDANTYYAFAPFVEFTVPQSPPLANVELLSVTCTNTDCTPNCTGKNCGENGCGDVCGSCGSGEVCNLNHQCEPMFGCHDGIKCILACEGDQNCVDGCANSVSLVDDQENLDLLQNCLNADCSDPLTPDCFLKAVYDIDKCGDNYDVCVGCTVSSTCTGLNCGDNTCGGSCHCFDGKICNANGSTCVACQSNLDCPEPVNPCSQAVCNAGACGEVLISDDLTCPDGTCQNGLCIPGSCSPQGVYFQCPMNNNPDVVQVPLSTDTNGKTVMLLGFAPNYAENGKLIFNFKIEDLVSLDSAAAAVYELEANGECGAAVSGFVITGGPQQFQLELPFQDGKHYVFSAPIELGPTVGSDAAIVSKVSLNCDATP